MSRSVSAPSSVTNTSPCWNGLIVPGSTFRYGSNFCALTERPRAFRSRPSDAATIPFPSADTTPPVTNTNLATGSNRTRLRGRSRGSSDLTDPGAGLLDRILSVSPHSRLQMDAETERGRERQGARWRKRGLLVVAWLLLSYVGASVMVWQVERFALKAYRNPSSSMEPTLHCPRPLLDSEPRRHRRLPDDGVGAAQVQRRRHVREAHYRAAG